MLMKWKEKLYKVCDAYVGQIIVKQKTCEKDELQKENADPSVKEIRIMRMT